ncbi:MAG TPA: chitobiase/beta-hexosaminidase C-terminal domain-containing protein [Acidobacteriaceae bacterium]
MLLAFSATLLIAEKTAPASQGIAWRVTGSWRLDGKGAPIVAGDAIPPGSLLQPDAGAADHSITIFLADGRGILYECFTPENCARGFRVPSLFRVPDPAAVDMLARIHETVFRGNASSSLQSDSDLPRGEVLTVIGPGNRVRVAGLAAALSNGRYTYDLRPLNPAYPTQSNVAVEKTAPAIPLTLPAPGLYDLKITDDLKTPRIDLLVAAVTPAQAEKFTKSYHQVQALMAQWNEAGFGWPIHDFQRAYLESLLHDSQPPTNAITSKAAATGNFVNESATEETHRDGVTAEPSFSPKPGLMDGDTAVILRSETPGASIHFTTDSSEPTADSPVYAAPIMIKGIGLTIRSFASSPGKKDSAVVTGIYRARNP